MPKFNNLNELLRPYRTIILIFILIAFILRIPLLQIRFFDPDEFQHLHGALQIHQGKIPYKDYFDHHTPFLHFLMSILYFFTGENVHILTVARALMLMFTALILCLIFILTKRLYGIDVGLFAVLILSHVLMFLEKTLEIRPDLGSTAFWLVAIIFLVKGVQEKSSIRCYIFSGISMGVALMFTPKSMFGLPGIFISLIYPFIDRRIGISWKQNAKLILGFLLGFLIPIALTILFFLINNGLWDFIYCNFIINSQWKIRFSPMGYINQLINQNPIFLVLGLAGLIINIFLIYKKDEISKGIYIPIFCSLSVITGLFILPVPYRQYYQLFLPFLAMYSAYILVKLVNFDIKKVILYAKTRQILPIIFIVFILMLIIGGLFIALKMSKPSMTNLCSILKFTHLKPIILYIVIWGILILFSVLFFIFKKREYAVMIIAIGMIMHPLDQMINQLSQRNDTQIANIQYILDNTSPTEAVLDGWSGFGFLRPNAFYYYFLHGEMRAMLSEYDLTDRLIKSIKENNTKIIIFDGDMRALPQKTKDYITNNYIYTKHGDLYIRKN